MSNLEYSVVKAELDNTRREFIQNKKQLQSYNNESTLLQGDRNNVLARFNRELEDAKRVELKRTEDALVKDLEDSIRGLESEKISKKSEYERNLATINFNSYMEKYGDKVNIDEELKKSTENLKQGISLALGDRFQNELMSMVAPLESDLDIQDVDKFTLKFNKLTSQINRMSKDSKINISGAIESVFKRISSEDLEGTPKQLMVYLGVLLVISFVIYKFLIVPLLIVYIIITVINIFKSYKIFHSVVEVKTITNNIESIEQAGREKIENLVLKDTEGLKENYKNSIEELNLRIDNLNNEISSKVSQLRKSFAFDETPLRNNLDITIKSLDNREVTLSVNIQDLEHKLHELSKKIKSLESDLETAAGNLMKEYITLDKIGKDNILDTKFLIDIQNSKPIFWTHPETSCLFVYDSLDEVTAFTRLLYTQLLCRLSAFNLSMRVYDKKYLGTSYSIFETKYPEIFCSYTTQEEIQSNLSSMYDTIAKRASTIKREFSNIKQYNEYMLTIDSLTEPYVFITCQDPEVSFVSEDIVTQLLLNGGDLGIYMHIFISRADFEKMKESAVELIEVVGTVYFIENGEILNRAKDYVVEMFSKDRN